MHPQSGVLGARPQWFARIPRRRINHTSEIEWCGAESPPLYPVLRVTEKVHQATVKSTVKDEETCEEQAPTTIGPSLTEKEITTLQEVTRFLIEKDSKVNKDKVKAKRLISQAQEKLKKTAASKELTQQSHTDLTTAMTNQQGALAHLQQQIRELQKRNSALQHTQKIGVRRKPPPKL